MSISVKPEKLNWSESEIQSPCVPDDKRSQRMVEAYEVQRVEFLGKKAIRKGKNEEAIVYLAYLGLYNPCKPLGDFVWQACNTYSTGLDGEELDDRRSDVLDQVAARVDKCRATGQYPEIQF